MSPRSRAATGLTAAVMVAALANVLAKATLARVPALTFAWLQMAIAAVCLGAYTFGWRRRLPRLPRGAWFLIAFVGLNNFAIVRALFLLGLERLPATTHAYLIQFAGVATMLASAVSLREAPRRGQWLGAGVALVGTQLYFRDAPSPSESAGVGLMVLGVCGLAATNIALRRLGVRYADVSSLTASTLAIGLGAMPLALVGLCADAAPWPSASDLAVIAANGAFGVALTMTVFTAAVRVLRAYEASLLASSGLVFTALFAAALLGERLHAHHVGGMVTMVAGIACVQACAAKSVLGRDAGR